MASLIHAPFFRGVEVIFNRQTKPNHDTGHQETGTFRGQQGGPGKEQEGYFLELGMSRFLKAANVCDQFAKIHQALHLGFVYFL